MPSTKDPNIVVQPGPGLLPAGVVPASALLFIPGGGASAALQAHINNPHDAHMAHAIGVDPYYPPFVGPTNDPILTSVGGVVDGESVLDFINQFKDLIPPRPNSIGFSAAAGGTGVPTWGNINPILTGGYQNGTNVQFTHYLLGNGVTSTGAITGLLFPADRGVVAFYKNTSGNFLDAPNTTLVGALWLGDPPSPAGIPDASFNETNRHIQQSNYVPSGAGIDQIGLTFRLPYLISYTPYPGTPYGPFTVNFYSYQLAVFSVNSQAISVGDAQDFLIVHWRETYATSLAAIQPVNLTLAHLTNANCYSGTPTSNTNYASGSWDDDTIAAFNCNRHFLFRDSNSAAAPVGTVFTSAPNGTPSTQFLSGVQYYNVASGAGSITWTVDIRATGLFANSFQTGSQVNIDIPTQFNSAFDPIQMDFTNFGGGLFPVPFYVMNKFGGGLYTPTNSPAPSDTGEYQNAGLAIYTPAPFVPLGGFAQLTADLRTGFQESIFVDVNKYLIDTYTPGAISTTTFEPFVDELYRYLTAFDPTTSATVSIIPSGGNIFPSSSALAGGGNSLQIAGQEVIYPQTNYSSGFFPTANPNYSSFPGGDGVNHVRRYMRAVDTGLATSSGWIRLRGLAQAAFTTNAPYNGGEATGHTTGGAIIQVKVPGASGSDWLDIGRQSGDPGVVGPLGTSPFYGCQTAVVISGSDIYVKYQTGTISTVPNGLGNFLLFIRITFLNGAGTTLALNQFQWYPPTFVPP